MSLSPSIPACPFLTSLHVHFCCLASLPEHLSTSASQCVDAHMSARVSLPVLPQGVVGIDGAPGAKGNVVRVLPLTPDAFWY